MPNTTETTQTSLLMPKDYIIWTLNNKANKINLPAIVFLAVLMFFGTFGNGFTIYVFRFRFKQTSVHIFIAWLAVFDMTSCCLSMPFELFEMRFPLMYGEPISCKVFRIIGFTAAITAALIMIFIAFDRYFSLCNPFHRFSTKKAKTLVLIGFLIAIIFAWPSAIIMGSRSIPTEVPGIVGTDCSYDDSLVDTLYPTVYYFILTFSVILIIIILIVVYIKIAIGIWKWKHNDVNNSLIGIASVSAAVIDRGLFSNRRKRYRSISSLSSRAYTTEIPEQIHYEKEIRRPKDVKSEKKMLEPQLVAYTNEKQFKPNDFSYSKLKQASQKQNLSLNNTFQIININTIFKKLRRCLSLDDISDVDSYKIKELKRNVSLPDFLTNGDTVHVVNSSQLKKEDEPTHGILVNRHQNGTKINLSSGVEKDNVTNDEKDNTQHRKRHSSVDFRFADIGESLHDDKPNLPKNIQCRTNVKTSFDPLHLHSDETKLKNYVSLEAHDKSSLKGSDGHNKHKSVSLSLSDLSKRTYDRQSSSSTIKSFTRQNSVKDKARIWRSNAIFIAITAVFIFSYLPFFILELLNRTGVLTLDSAGDLANQLFEVFTKSIYLNNVANPFIYGMLNSKFRKEIRKLFCGNSF